jgi:hypothetical protein
VTITAWPEGGGTSDLFAGAGTTGLVTSAAGDAGKYLKADGTWDTVTSTATNATLLTTNGVRLAEAEIGSGLAVTGGVMYVTATGTDGAAVTNISRSVAFGAVTPHTLTSAATVTVPRLVGTNAFVLTLTNASVTLAIDTNAWTSAEVARFSIDVNRGTNTLAFTTGHMSGSTVLDVPASTLTPLFFRKPSGAIQWRVRQ